MPNLGLSPDEMRRRIPFLYSQSFSLGANASGQISIKSEQDSYFIVQSMVSSSTGNFQARMRDDGSGKIWQSDYVQNVNVFGTAQRPNLLVVPLIIPPMSSTVIDLVDTSGAPNTGEIVLSGYKVYASQFTMPNTGKIDSWFQYVGSKAIAGSSIDTITIRLQADAHFEVHKLIARIPGGLPTTGAFSARISDSDTSKSWSDRSVGRDNQFGTAQYPVYMTMPKLLRPNIVVQIEITELSTATNQVEIVLEGAKRYI